MNQKIKIIGLKLSGFDPLKVSGRGVFFVTVIMNGSSTKYFKRQIPVLNLRAKGSNHFIGKIVYVTPIFSQHGNKQARGRKISSSPVSIVKYVSWDKTKQKQIIIWKIRVPNNWTRRFYTPRQFISNPINCLKH